MMMRAMTTVHEQMHQWADQDKQKRQSAKDVCPVLGKQKKCRDRAQNQQADAKTRAPQVSWLARLGGCRVLHGDIRFDGCS